MAERLKIIPGAPRCQHLLSKGLYINAGLAEGEGIVGDGNFWCAHNLSTYGPDKRLCDGDQCRDGSRNCYEAP